MENKYKEIEELANDSLVELLDYGFTLNVQPLTGYCMITIKNSHSTPWENIKENLIFFFEVMTNSYKLHGRNPITIGGNPVTLDKILSDELKQEDVYDDYTGYSDIRVFIG